MDDLLLLGAGGHSKAVVDVVEREGRFRIAGIIDDTLPSAGQFCGYPILGTDADLKTLRKNIGHALIGVGQIRSPAIRHRLFDMLTELGFSLPCVVSPSAEISRRASLGPGTVAMHFSAVGPDSAIGRNVILNTRSLVEHDGRIGDDCHISTGCILNGNVSIGRGTFVGSGSIVREGIIVGENCFIAMGSRLVTPLATGSKYKELTQ